MAYGSGIRRRRWDGPVAITGADGHVGRVLRRRLADLPNAVRPLGRGDDWSAAIRDAEVVVHLAGALKPRRGDTYRVANVATVERCVDALAGSCVERVVLLSYVGADPAAHNAYLRTKGEAEQLVRHYATPAVIVRSTYVYGDPDDIGPSFASYQAQAGGAVWVLGGGRQRVMPIHVDDLAALLMSAALDPAAPTGTFEVGGPTTYALNAFVRRINPPDVTIRHLPAVPARLLARVLPQLTPALVDVLLRDSVVHCEPHEAAARFGIRVHDVAAIPAGRTTS